MGGAGNVLSCVFPSCVSPCIYSNTNVFLHALQYVVPTLHHPITAHTSVSTACTCAGRTPPPTPTPQANPPQHASATHTPYSSHSRSTADARGVPARGPVSSSARRAPWYTWVAAGAPAGPPARISKHAMQEMRGGRRSVFGGGVLYNHVDTHLCVYPHIHPHHTSHPHVFHHHTHAPLITCSHTSTHTSKCITMSTPHFHHHPRQPLLKATTCCCGPGVLVVLRYIWL